MECVPVFRPRSIDDTGKANVLDVLTVELWQPMYAAREQAIDFLTVVGAGVVYI